MTTAVDSNVFFDLLAGTPQEAAFADAALHHAVAQGELVLSTVTYAELAHRFSTQPELDKFLGFLDCKLSPLQAATAYLAGTFFRQHLKRGGKRDRILPDFLIAAHAQLQADRLLTRDKRFFAQTFPKLRAVSPADLAATSPSSRP